MEKDIYKRSRICYIISATLEYFISILVGGAYLAKLTTTIGISDGLTGVISSFISLGCGFQIISLFFKTEKPVKHLCIILNLINQLCFTFLYIIPLFDISTNAKTVIFIILLLIGYIMMNIVFSPKVIWSRTMIDDSRRGVFSASCEMTSLISGMIFTMVMGRVIDSFEKHGNIKGSFILTGITLFALTMLHALMLILMREDKREKQSSTPMSVRLKESLFDKNMLKLLPLFILYNTALYITVPYFGTYEINNLGFSMTAVSLMSVGYAVVRTAFSIPFGKLGDKKTFSVSISLAMLALAVGLIINSLGGAITHIIYYMLYAVSLAGTNSGLINIIFDKVENEKRTGAVAILYTVGGFVGFFATLAVKPLVDLVQSSGNTFLGIESFYAQQLLSIIGAALLFLCILYVYLISRKKKTA